MFKKEITTTSEDYKNLVYFTEFKQKPYVIPLMVLFIIIAVAMLAFGLFGILPVYISVPIAAVFALASLFFPYKAKLKAKQGIKNGKVALNAKRTLEYDTTGLKIYGGRTETNINMPWNTMFAIYETDKCFIVYLTFQSAFVIGKSQLTLQEVIDMRNYFEKQMQNRFFLLCER